MPLSLALDYLNRLIDHLGKLPGLDASYRVKDNMAVSRENAVRQAGVRRRR